MLKNGLLINNIMTEDIQIMDFKDNYSVKNKWIADINLSRISSDLKDISLHLTDFSIPALSVASSRASYKGVSIEIPTHIIQPNDRNIMFNYMIDLEWYNYFSLYQWCNMLSPIENIIPSNSLTTDNYTINNIKTIPINVFLLDQYKKPILKIMYDNCWIKGFNELSLSYQEEPIELKHGFTCVYSTFKLEKL